MRDMTEGSVTKRMLVFSVPFLFGNVLQQLYNTAAAVIVGQFAGKRALAAVGAASPIMNILTFLMVGITLGTSVLISEFFGAGDREKVREEQSTALLAGLIFTVVLSAAAIFLIRPMLFLIQTPNEIVPEAESYLRIIIAGLVFSFFYNLLSSSLRAIGNAMMPLLFLFLSCALNIGMSMVLVGNFQMGVKGAAYSTVISQAVSVLLCVGYIFRRVPVFRFRLRGLKINTELLKRTVNYSSVSAVQQTFLYVGVLILQGAVNPLGVDAIAAYSAVTKIDGFILAPTDSLALALTIFTSLNRGAGKTARVRAGLKNSMAIGAAFCLPVAFAVYFLAGTLMSFFLKPWETKALAIGAGYLKAMALFYLFPAVTNSFQGFFRGLGRMDITLGATVIQIPVRVILAYLLVGRFGMSVIAYCIAVGWLCMTVYEAMQYRHYFRKGEGSLMNEQQEEPQKTEPRM
ncbi:MAG TPA: MATE family efflux transporter [Ruminococcaceae bacterium]|jgi:putative MATE family efflux protein|nr:MATE family efflux transporter [Oscillospiraceae bacterium]